MSGVVTDISCHVMTTKICLGWTNDNKNVSCVDSTKINSRQDIG